MYIILRSNWCDITVPNVHPPTKDKTDNTKDSFCEELERVLDKFPKYDLPNRLGDFCAKVGREYIFEPTIWNESLHEISNNNWVRVVNFAASKNLIIKIAMFPHRKINKFTLTSLDWKAHNQIDHILVDKRRNSSVSEVPSFRGAGCATDHTLVVAYFRERLTVTRPMQKFDTENFSLKKLNEIESKDQNQVKISNRFAA
jgi:hypothetical protein